MQLQEKTTGITQGLPLGVASPQRCGLGETVGAGGGDTPPGFGILRASGAGGSGWDRTAQARLRWRVRRRMSLVTHALMNQLTGVGRGAGARDFGPSLVLLSTPNLTRRGRRPSQIRTRIPISRLVHRIRGTDGDVFGVVVEKIRHGAELIGEMGIPRQARRIDGRIIHGAEDPLHGHVPIWKRVSILVFVIGVGAEREHVLTMAGQVHAMLGWGGGEVPMPEDVGRVDMLLGYRKPRGRDIRRRSADGTERFIVGTERVSGLQGRQVGRPVGDPVGHAMVGSRIHWPLVQIHGRVAVEGWLRRGGGGLIAGGRGGVKVRRVQRRTHRGLGIQMAKGTGARHGRVGGREGEMLRVGAGGGQDRIVIEVKGIQTEGDARGGLAVRGKGRVWSVQVVVRHSRIHVGVIGNHQGRRWYHRREFSRSLASLFDSQLGRSGAERMINSRTRHAVNHSRNGHHDQGTTTRTMKRVISRLNSHVPFFRRHSSSGPDEERNQIRRCDVDLASGRGGMLGRADSHATGWVVLSEL